MSPGQVGLQSNLQPHLAMCPSRYLSFLHRVPSLQHPQLRNQSPQFLPNRNSPPGTSPAPTTGAPSSSSAKTSSRTPRELSSSSTVPLSTLAVMTAWSSALMTPATPLTASTTAATEPCAWQCRYLRIRRTHPECQPPPALRFSPHEVGPNLKA